MAIEWQDIKRIYIGNENLNESEKKQNKINKLIQ